MKDSTGTFLSFVIGLSLLALIAMVVGLHEVGWR
jgi:tetrahydromethanopterin S-methyltransferase subunit B